jgi:hypothetical protein
MATTRVRAARPNPAPRRKSDGRWPPRLAGLLALAGGWWASSLHLGTVGTAVLWLAVAVVATPLLTRDGPADGDGGDWGGADDDSGGGDAGEDGG